MHKSDVEQHIAILESALKNAKGEHAAKRLSELIALLDELQCLREMLDYLVDVIPEQKEKNRVQVMTLDEAIEIYKSNAEYERTHGNLQGCLDFRQLEEWLTDYKRMKEQEPCENTISREDALMCMTGEYIADITYKPEDIISKHIQRIRSLPPVKPQEQRWTPVSEGLPEELEPVNVTWINHSPKSYYADIKDKPFAATGVYFNGQWYWWSTGCTDILAEYSHNYADIIDDDIEITAWMPLPIPYKPQESEDKENE